MESSKIARIRALNDRMRSDFRNGHWLITPRVRDHPDSEQLLERVRTFQHFEDRNDPYHEHDFGAFRFGDETYFWKIDYYDQSLTMASSDPSEEAVTRRVLTVMHASEY
ncbi:MAG: DUF3768 domain-containing protein [Alphaproteobacteria bacterium]|nr:DUF3768 domain-containing protein [Alphaproteobacteria bacterium]